MKENKMLYILYDWAEEKNNIKQLFRNKSIS